MRWWMAGGWALGLAALVAVGGACKAEVPVFSAERYRHPLFEYEVQALPGSGELIEAPWRLDNYYRRRPGAELRPKKDAEELRLKFDMDGDGEYEVDRQHAAADLVFVNDETSAVIRLRTIPISGHARTRSLEVVMNEFLESLAGAEGEVRWTGVAVATEAKTYAATRTDFAEAKLAGAPAVIATIDIANLEQLKLDPNHRYRRLRVLIARMPFEYQISRGRRRAGEPSVPVLLVATYTSLPQHFDQGVPTFHGLLGRVSVGPVGGLELAVSAPSGAPAPAAPTPAAPAPDPAAAPTPAPAASTPAPPAASALPAP